MPATMAFLSGCAEICLPVILILGLGTRFAALGLLFMTIIVELTVPDGWPIHITWAAMSLGIMSWGPGRASIDSSRPAYAWSYGEDIRRDSIESSPTSHSKPSKR
ncbi:MAG: DoxX family protein [Rhizomicrobium sp.]